MDLSLDNSCLFSSTEFSLLSHYLLVRPGRKELEFKDDVRIVEGPSKGKQGPVKHIYKGVLFIYDRRNHKHAGFSCVKCTSCILVGGRGWEDYSLLGTVKIRLGPFRGYSGPVIEVKGNAVLVELEMRIVTVGQDAISTPSRDSSRDNMGSETPMFGFMSDILVEVHKTGDVGVIRVVSDEMCKVSLGSSGEGDTVMVLPSELEIVPPRKNDRVKIVGGQFRGSIGSKLIRIDGTYGIVKREHKLDFKILDLAILAKFIKS